MDIFYWNSLQTNNALGILKTYYFCGSFVLLDIIPLSHSRAETSFGNSKSTDLLTTLKRNNHWVFLLLQDFPILFNHMNALQCNPVSMVKFFHQPCNSWAQLGLWPELQTTNHVRSVHAQKDIHMYIITVEIQEFLSLSMNRT